MENIEDDREDELFRGVCESLVVPVLKPKKAFNCYKCGLKIATKHRLDCHMKSRNCNKRIRIDDDESPEPHESIGNNFKKCIDIYKSAKEKNYTDEKIL